MQRELESRADAGVREIESQVAGLSSAELAAFRSWFLEFDASVWNRQFEAPESSMPWRRTHYGIIGTREELAAKSGLDVRAILVASKKRQDRSVRKVVSFAPKKKLHA